MLRVSQLSLPQCLLGSEAQLAGFAAALPAPLAARCVFAPLPEVFGNARSLHASLSACGAAPGGRLVHVRFGSVRTARVFKGAHNVAAVAEDVREGPLATSGHPFASGRHLPAAMERVLAFAPFGVAPMRVDGAALPVSVLPETCTTADLEAAPATGGGIGAAGGAAGGGLDLASFETFRSGAWAEGPVSGTLRAAEAPLVLLPWNLDHPGSIVPELLRRLARLQSPTRPRVRLLVLPFNYLGQTGIIRRLIRQVADAAGDEAALAHYAVARLTRLAALPRLRALSGAAWVEAGDPEHGWTLRRLAAAGIGATALPQGEERIWLEVETRYGTLAHHAAVPSLRQLAALLERAAAR